MRKNRGPSMSARQKLDRDQLYGTAQWLQDEGLFNEARAIRELVEKNIALQAKVAGLKIANKQRKVRK